MSEVRGALAPHVKAAIKRIDDAKDQREANKRATPPGETPLKYVIVATGNIYDDAVQAKAAAHGGADIVAVIRATAQSLLDYVPHGATTEGYGGTFATLYLAPKDYHRIHVPLDGDVVAATYIPGELWPVNVHAVAHVADLFAVNERIVVTVRGRAGGTMAVVLVGATMVGTTRVAFDDLHTNAQRRIVQRRGYEPAIPMRAGDLLGHFEFGSTVIVVCSRYAGEIDPLAEGDTVRMGQRLGRRGASSPRGA